MQLVMTNQSEVCIQWCGLTQHTQNREVNLDMENQLYERHKW